MKEIKEIIPNSTHSDGIKVPEGYFEDFAARMSQILPERPELDVRKITPPRSIWQRVRPYAFMAAMFAGVWCMLKMFTMMSGVSTEISFDNDPVLSDAASNDIIVSEIIDDVSHYEFYEYCDYELLNADSLGLDIDTSKVSGLVIE
ncbi:MAG: hypothetical protein J6C44_00660 [Muribaculaceae bacterium]|nr:hypothetical protein [Muribaculaceae bacterium]